MVQDDRCSVCSAPLDPDDDRCPSCGSAAGVAMHRLSRALDIVGGESETTDEAGAGSPVLILCPGCGAVVSTADAQCARCGTNLSQAGAELDAFLKPLQREATAPARAAPPPPRECPACGSAVLPGESRCDACGSALSITRAPPSSASEGVCPACSAPLALGAASCTACGVRILGPQEPVPLVRKKPVGRMAPHSPTAPAEQPTPARAEEPETRAPPRPSAKSTGPRSVVAAKGRRLARGRIGPRELRAEAALEIAVYSSAPAGPALGAVYLLGSSIGGWVVVAGLAALLAAGLALLGSGRRPRLGRREFLATITGAVLLAVPAALALAAIPLAWPAALGSALVGAAVLVAVLVLRSTLPEAFVPWSAALPALLASAVALVQSPRLGVPAALATWPAAAGPIGVTLALVARERSSAKALARHVERGRREYASHDLAKSLEEFDRAIAAAHAGPGADVAWFGKGVALIALDRSPEAITCLDTALQLNPLNEAAWVNRGNALTKMGRLLEALRSYNHALRVSPRYEIAWNNKGNALTRMGRFREALTCYERALEIDGAYRAAWVNKGFALTKMGQFEEAARCADRAAQVATDTLR